MAKKRNVPESEQQPHFNKASKKDLLDLNFCLESNLLQKDQLLEVESVSVEIWFPSVCPCFSCLETLSCFCLEQTFGMNLKHVCCMFWHGDMLARLCYDEHNALKTFKKCL